MTSPLLKGGKEKGRLETVLEGRDQRVPNWRNGEPEGGRKSSPVKDIESVEELLEVSVGPKGEAITGTVSREEAPP